MESQEQFRFYHGTSSIFLDSIKTTGLGGINPNLEYKNLDLLQYLFSEAEILLPHDVRYQGLRVTTAAMVNQTPVELVGYSGQKQLLHFRHHGMFVAISMMRAIVYAAANQYGSEILKRIIDLLLLLREVDANFSIPSELNLFDVEKYINIQSTPIIIEVHGIQDDEILKEDGKTAKEALDFIRRTLPTLTEREKFIFLQHCNFELLKPIPSSRLKFYKLEYEGFPGQPDFFYSLSRFEK